VATRVIGTDEVIIDEETGLLVPPHDPGALGAAMSRLLSDPSLRARLGQAGCRRYLGHFTSARMAADTRALYERAVSAAEAARLTG